MYNMTILTNNVQTLSWNSRSVTGQSGQLLPRRCMLEITITMILQMFRTQDPR